MKSMVCVLLALVMAPAWCEDINDVLERSQRVRLESLPRADTRSDQAAIVRQSFERVLQASAWREPVELRVIRGETVAETLHGDVVVANESLADLTEGERVFILAHELGHVAMGHWLQLGRLYKRYVPGEVTQDKTDPIADALGREASGLSHRHELEADAFSLHMLQAMGHADEDAISALKRMGLTRDTATHPGTRKRVASLREAQSGALGSAAFMPSEEALNGLVILSAQGPGDRN
jgi:hypothetical protein